MNNIIEYLIISSSIDFSSDLICLELEKRNKPYLRVNRDYFSDYEITYDVNKEELSIRIDTEKYLISNDCLKSIFFRAPVFIRAYGKKYDLNAQVSQSQWNAFLRNLVVFDKAKWINHPVATYRAENKLLQLKLAKTSGLLIPETYLVNSFPSHLSSEKYAIKALDTPIFYDNGDELFTYTMILSHFSFKRIFYFFFTGIAW